MMLLFFSILPVIMAVLDGLDVTPFVNGMGIAGVLAFILIKMDPRLRAIETSIDRLARAMMLLKISHPDCSRSEREEAQEILRELDEKKEKK